MGIIDMERCIETLDILLIRLAHVITMIKNREFKN